MGAADQVGSDFGDAEITDLAPPGSLGDGTDGLLVRNFRVGPARSLITLR
jgi:hypothetical protein